MAKIEIRVDYDWLYGHLRYGHREGILDLENEDYEEFKKDPKAFLSETGAIHDLNFVLDDFDLEDYGDCTIQYEEVQ